MTEKTFDVEEKHLEPKLVASVRINGKYSECGKGFGRIGRHFGRFICGKAMLLIHDGEYRANDAHFEAVMPIKRGESTEDINVYELPGGRCLSLIHLGPYDQISQSYGKIIEFAEENDFEFGVPTREVYLKGPGMFFKGNPKKYRTEIQLMAKDVD